MNETLTRCPACDSPAPHLHPAVQFEGEVQPCNHDFHRRITPENTPAIIALNDSILNPAVVETATATAVNLNDYVWVILLHDAEDVMRSYYRKLGLDPMKHTRPSENGWTRFQLHELMEMFGPEMIAGTTRRMFLNNVLRLEPVVAGAAALRPNILVREGPHGHTVDVNGKGIHTEVNQTQAQHIARLLREALRVGAAALPASQGRRRMRLPENTAYPDFHETHLEDHWCAKAGCIPVIFGAPIDLGNLNREQLLKELEAAQNKMNSAVVARITELLEEMATKKLGAVLHAIRDLEGLPVVFGLAKKLSEVAEYIAGELPKEPK